MKQEKEVQKIEKVSVTVCDTCGKEIKENQACIQFACKKRIGEMKRLPARMHGGFVSEEKLAFVDTGNNETTKIFDFCNEDCLKKKIPKEVL